MAIAQSQIHFCSAYVFDYTQRKKNEKDDLRKLYLEISKELMFSVQAVPGDINEIVSKTIENKIIGVL